MKAIVDEINRVLSENLVSIHSTEFVYVSANTIVLHKAKLVVGRTPVGIITDLFIHKDSLDSLLHKEIVNEKKV